MLSRKKTNKYFVYIISYSLALSILVFFLKWIKWNFFILKHSNEIYIGLIALTFTILGIWVARQFTKEKTVIIEKKVEIPVNEFNFNEEAFKELALTNREYSVLQLMSKGFSNKEIADELFLSTSTIKTHVSNILSKMNVKNRTQAVNKARYKLLVP